VELSGKAAKWVREAGAYIALEKGAWQDWRFASLPEFLHNRYESAVSVPLIEAGKLNGIVNVCGRLPTRCGPGEGIFLAGLSLPLGSILAKTRLESELEDLNRKLADRKLFDRAKGVLQARFGWTEEDAYLHLCRTSRRTRTPMRSVALHVIQNFALPNEQVA
jgi:hypothetical protein